MAISDQIIRLQSAKIDMKTAIENFNISIPNNAKLDTYDDYIRLISMDANATSKDILNGKTAYVGGQKINGTALSIATSANNATIFNGFTAYDSNGQLLTGNALATTTNATNNHILKGYTAYNSAGALLNGTAFGNVTNATNAQILSGQSAYLNNGFYLSGTMTNYAGSSLSAGNIIMNNTAFALNSSVNAYVSTSTQFYTTWDNFMDKAYTAESNGNIDFYVGRIGYSTQTFSGMTDSADFKCDGRPRGYILMQMSYVDDIWDATDQDKIIIGIQDAVWQDSPSTTTQNVVVAYGSTTSSYDDRVRIRTYENVVDVTYHSDTQILSLVLNSEARSDVYFYGKYRFLYWY